ncbi:MAG: hypothetical protein QMD53_02095 [Actinomycetota bacterium]|nr:hypothetical protein [Actinomycetota bacterium]
MEAVLVPKKAGDLEATLTLKYTGDFNQEQMIEKKLPVKVEQAEASENGASGGATGARSILDWIVSLIKGLLGLGG